ncbi:MAG TPA: type II toxin-antitoxin system VapC family toxin [Terriglobia bacterium]|nr:type II toxin-antitoxin system VapC family toxin [Terriglobia bacterium]
MSRFVLDASVAVKWFLPPATEPLAKEAWRFFALHMEGRIWLSVPDLFWTECTNVFWKAARQGRITWDAAEEAIQNLLGQSLYTLPSRELLYAAFGIARKFNHPVYDCLYVALAVRSNAQLITADERLANALAAHLPVKWLGSA